MSVRVTIVLFSFLFSSMSALLFGGADETFLDEDNIYDYCTVAAKVVIKSMKTGAFLVGDDVGQAVLAENEDILTGNQFWTIEAANGFYIIRNLKTSAILDIEGGCWEGMHDVNVITYDAKSAHPNNRFYINSLDNTIGVQCYGAAKLRLKVDEIGQLIAAIIDNPKTSDEDIHFAIEPIS